MQAFIATIRTATAAATELLIAETEAAALADAERRHNTDSQTVLITVEAAEFDTVIVVGSVTTDTRSKPHQPVISIRRPASADAGTTTPAKPTRVTVPFSVFGEVEPVLREVELLKSYDDGYSRVRLDTGATATVHTSTIRPLSAATLASAPRHQTQALAA